tara:strand:+ start:4541 stop:5416 length:876 start_codon:yes stop_codon:yes gene_type:complete
MSIIVNSQTKLLVQGITGKEGSFHAKKCKEYGTNLVAGAVPGRDGEIFDESVPIFDSVQDAIDSTEANTSLIFVPPHLRADDAIIEAVDAGIQVVICITEGVPVMDMVKVSSYIRDKDVILIGPNCPGAISPAPKVKVGIMPGDIHMPGKVGVVSRSGTLTYEAVGQLSKLGIGQSTCVGIGGDPVTGISFVDVLEMFQQDDETEAVVLIGEIGGNREQEAAEYIKHNFKKPVASLIVGQTAPKGKRMGHAGAIITGKDGLAEEKIRTLSSAGASIIPSIADIGEVVKGIV